MDNSIGRIGSVDLSSTPQQRPLQSHNTPLATDNAGSDRIPLSSSTDTTAAPASLPKPYYVCVSLNSARARAAFQPFVGLLDGAVINSTGGGCIELTYKLHVPPPLALEGDGWSIKPTDAPLLQKPIRVLSLHHLEQILTALQIVSKPQPIIPPEYPPAPLPPLSKEESINAMRQFVQFLHFGVCGVTEFRLIHSEHPAIILWANIEINHEINKILEQIYTYNQQGYNAYVGIATRREQKDSGGGSKEDVLFTRVLWADLDGVISLPKIDSRIVAPSLIHQSGGGLHLYWMLEAPIEADAELEAALKALAWTLGGDPQVAEAARIMRLPGTINHKPGRRGAPCKELARSSADHVYPINRFDKLREDYTPVRVWPKLFANAMHINMEVICRFWAYLHHLDTAEYDGQGWIPFSARAVAASLGVNERTVRNWLREDERQNSLFFRRYDAKRKRLYVRGQVEVAARLAALASAKNAFDPEIVQDRSVDVPLFLLKGSGKSPNWEAFCATVFNGWIGLYEAKQYRITWELIERTWRRSRPHIETWIKFAGIRREHNIAMLPLPHNVAPEHPDFEDIYTAPTGPSGPEWTAGINQTGHHWYGLVNGIRCKFWQRGNTYLANQLRLRLPQAYGKSEKMRRAADKAVGREASAGSEQARDHAGLFPDEGFSVAGHCSDCADADDDQLRTNFEEVAKFIERRVSHPDLPLYLAQPAMNGSFRHGSPIRVQRFSPNAAFDRQTNWQTELIEGREHPAKKRKTQRNTAAAVLQGLARTKAA